MLSCLAVVLLPRASAASGPESVEAETESAVQERLERQEPPEDVASTHDAVPTEPRDEASRISRARELIASGSAQFELADYAGTVERWEQAYDLLPLSMRGQLQVPLANAHRLAYEVERDEEHLRKARVLLSDHLDALDPADEAARAEVEGQLAEVRAELERLAAEREQAIVEQVEREQEMIEREAVAREEVAREIQTERMKALDPWTEEDRRRFRIMTGIGGALGGLGVVSLSTMAAGLSLGASIERQGEELATEPGAPLEDFRGLLREGRSYNRLAWGTGAAGSVLLLSGAVLVSVAASRRRRAKKQLQVRARPSMRRLEVFF